MRVLIIEDDVDVAELLAEYLEVNGFVSHIENTGEGGRFEAMEGGFDAIVLDLGLPDIDGTTLLEEMREAGLDTPVIILTARQTKDDIVKGLDAGADDYVKKEFDMDEVVARLRAHIRRAAGHTQNEYKYKDIMFNSKSQRLFNNGNYIKLTNIETMLVQYLFTNQGTTINSKILAEHVYQDYDNDSEVIQRHVSNIRKKVGMDIIKNEIGKGYYVPLEKE